ncbi:hypothetical protein FRB94_005027 [Tulasnella sp. JGI-2019a]|nr:hypothetical protein FRB94_005027 [Tulasnella sp. JGI-2019a]KAG9008182.1 hypothetical protein FRB93_006750 [Tulasnella sp. JGI-2019a]KAG9023861.1 hypothetical protein FRB95_012393 [Tulasnella sp. JGI-2019a]
MVGTRNSKVVSYKESSDLDSDSDSPQDSTDLEYEDRPKKKAKLSRTKKTTARPCIPFWTILPLDVVHEILRWLQPIDLLQLARSTKTLRSHLMNRASLSVWKAARGNVIGGTPECPEYMSEPAFARLLFANECFVCGKLGGSLGPRQGWRIYWTIQMRCCPNCVFNSFITRRFIHEHIPEIENTELVAELLPSAYMKRHKRWTSRYYVSAIQEMATAIEDHENLILARVSGAEEAFEAFKNTHRTKVTAMSTDAHRFDMWHGKYGRLVRNRKRELEAQREEVFVAKLIAEGNHPDDAAAAYRPFITGEQLTEDGWADIRPRVQRLVNRSKKERLKRERESLLDRRRAVVIDILRRRPVNININYSPSPEDVAYGFEPITLVVEREGDEEVTEEDFEGAFEGIEEWVKERKTEREEARNRFFGWN